MTFFPGKSESTRADVPGVRGFQNSSASTRSTEGETGA